MSSALHHIPHRTKKLPPLREGIGGPVGSGKTTLLEMLCKTMRDKYDLVAITNDIYTKEDQRLLTVSGALAADIPAAVDHAIRLPDSQRQAFSPMLAILSSQHEVQYSRLFRS